MECTTALILSANDWGLQHARGRVSCNRSSSFGGVSKRFFFLFSFFLSRPRKRVEAALTRLQMNNPARSLPSPSRYPWWLADASPGEVVTRLTLRKKREREEKVRLKAGQRVAYSVF